MILNCGGFQNMVLKKTLTLGPDHLESTIFKITGKIIQNLLSWKIVDSQHGYCQNNKQKSNIFRNNKLLCNNTKKITGIDDQGLSDSEVILPPLAFANIFQLHHFPHFQPLLCIHTWFAASVRLESFSAKVLY